MRDELTRREKQVLLMAARGLTANESAERLGISERTVSTHFMRIFEKLDVSKRAQAVVRALELGIISLEEIEQCRKGGR